MKVNSSLLHQRDSYPKKWHFWRWKTRRTWMRSTNPGQDVSHHQTFWNFPEANISIFTCTSGLSQEAMIVKNIFSFTSSSHNPLRGNSCNYYFHMNHYVLPTLQPHSPKISVLTAKTHANTDLSYRSKCKQASCRTFLHVYFVNPTHSNFISQRTRLQLSPGGQGESDSPFCGEPLAMDGCCVEVHCWGTEHFSLNVELPLNSLIIAPTLCTHVHSRSCGWEAHLAPALCKPCKASFSRPLKLTWAFPQASSSLRPDPHSLILKDIRTALSIFRQGLSHHPTAARPGQWPAQPAFSTSPQGRPYSLHSLCSFSSYRHREKLDAN